MASTSRILWLDLCFLAISIQIAESSYSQYKKSNHRNQLVLLLDDDGDLHTVENQGRGKRYHDQRGHSVESLHSVESGRGPQRLYDHRGHSVENAHSVENHGNAKGYQHNHDQRGHQHSVESLHSVENQGRGSPRHDDRNQHTVESLHSAESYGTHQRYQGSNDRYKQYHSYNNYANHNSRYADKGNYHHSQNVYDKLKPYVNQKALDHLKNLLGDYSYGEAGYKHNYHNSDRDHQHRGERDDKGYQHPLRSGNVNKYYNNRHQDRRESYKLAEEDNVNDRDRRYRNHNRDYRDYHDRTNNLDRYGKNRLTDRYGDLDRNYHQNRYGDHVRGNRLEARDKRHHVDDRDRRYREYNYNHRDARLDHDNRYKSRDVHYKNDRQNNSPVRYQDKSYYSNYLLGKTYKRPSESYRIRNYNQLRSRMDTLDKEEQDENDKYLARLQALRSRLSKTLQNLGTSPVKSLLRAADDLDCAAQFECKNDCQNTKKPPKKKNECAKTCEKKITCNDQPEEEEDLCQESGHDSCGGPAGSGSTKGETFIDEEKKDDDCC